MQIYINEIYNKYNGWHIGVSHCVL
jgi:hypothetical protein